MKFTKLALSATALVALYGCGKQQEAVLPENATDLQKESYALGKMVGTQIGNDFDEVDSSLFSTGFNHGMNKKDGYMTDKEMMAVLVNARTRIQDEAKQLSQQQKEENAKEEKDFLAKNAKVKGVVTTDSGLQYAVIKAGEGKPQVKTDKDEVTVNYKGTLLDGTVFDSSYDRKEAATFSVSGLITGWKEALRLMPIGAKWKLFVPSQLAYGNKKVGKIEPHSMLVFEIELLDVNGKLAKDKKKN